MDYVSYRDKLQEARIQNGRVFPRFAFVLEVPKAYIRKSAAFPHSAAIILSRMLCRDEPVFVKAGHLSDNGMIRIDPEIACYRNQSNFSCRNLLNVSRWTA